MDVACPFKSIIVVKKKHNLVSWGRNVGVLGVIGIIVTNLNLQNIIIIMTDSNTGLTL